LIKRKAQSDVPKNQTIKCNDLLQKNYEEGWIVFGYMNNFYSTIIEKKGVTLWH